MIKKLLTTLLVAGILLTPSVSFATTPHFQVDTGGTLTTNLQAYYKLEDTTDFWGTNNLTNNNSVTFVAGKVGNAANFVVASSQYLSLAAPLSTSVDNVSIFMWVYVPSTSEKGGFLMNGKQGSGVNDGYGIGIGGTTFDDTGNHLIGLVQNVAWMDFGTNIGTGWHFVGMIRNAGTWTGYIDNVAAATTYTSTPITPTSNFVVGAGLTFVNEYWNNKIDEVGFWNKALSTTEITDLYNSGNGQTMVVTTALAPMQVLWIGY